MVGFRHRLATKDAAHKGAGKGVASTNGISHLYLRGLLKGHLTRCEDIRAIGAAGEHEHIEVVLTQDEPALVLNVEAGIAKHAVVR